MFAEVVGDGLDALLGPVEQVHFEVCAGHLGEFDEFAGDEGCSVAVDRDNGVVGGQKVCRSGALGVVGAVDSTLTQQVVEGLTAALGDEALPGGDTAVDARFDTVAGQKRLVAGVAFGRSTSSVRRSRYLPYESRPSGACPGQRHVSHRSSSSGTTDDSGTIICGSAQLRAMDTRRRRLSTRSPQSRRRAHRPASCPKPTD